MDKKTGVLISVGLLLVLGAIVSIGILTRKTEDDENILTEEDERSMMLGGQLVDEITNEGLEKYPILKWIPYIVDEYSKDMTVYTHYEIQPVFEDDGMIVAIKDYTGGNEQIAKEKIESLGINLSDYKIEYEDLSSEYGSVRVSDD